MSEMTYADKPWLKSYQLGPYKLDKSLAPYPAQPVFRALEIAAENYPGQTAVLYLERSMNYAQLKKQVDSLAAGLSRLGIGRGDRVCLFLPNCVEFILSDWAVMKTGAAVVPTSILRTVEGLQHEVGSAGARAIICREEQLEKVLAVRSACSIEHIIVTSTQGYDVSRVSGTLPPGMIEFRRLLEENDPVAPAVEIDPVSDLCELSFTGGATGVPKGVMLTHFNRYSCILQGFAWLLKPVLRGFAGKASVIVPIPIFHSYGHFVIQMATYLGLRIILMPDPRDIDLLTSYLHKYRPFILTAVPTQLMRLADADLPRMNILPMSGSAPLPMEVAEELRQKIGVPVSEGYGLTETSPSTHYNLSAFSKITGFMPKLKTGIGVPSPDTECDLVDPQSGRSVPFGAPGELLIRGPQVMQGYWPDRGSGLTADGWLHTGDIATMDEDGYFQIVDRIKDMVNVSGLKVYTTSVDEVLFKHPAVSMAAAFGVPDARRPGSEQVMAVIKLKQGYEGQVSEEDIRAHCRALLPPYAVPVNIEFRQELPLTVTEKVFKRVLRDEVLARLQPQVEVH